MRWLVATFIGLVMALSSVSGADAVQLLVSGQADVFVDTGAPAGPDPTDGMFMFDINGNTLTVQTGQDPNSSFLDLLLALSGPFTFNVASFQTGGSAFALEQLGSPPAPGCCADANGMAEQVPGGEAFVMTVNESSGLRSAGALCNEGGLAVRVRTTSGQSILVGLDLVNCDNLPCVIDTQSPTFIRVNDVPFRTIYYPVVWKLLDVYIPVSAVSAGDVHLTGAVGSDAPFMDVALSQLGECPALTLSTNKAPAGGTLALIAAALAVLFVGTWGMSRRPKFRALLPTP
ncbi:MAG: hypothetical protein HY699_11400 [Deltaproteobacteria bacterium]|nr:hypothetical protein [Deltaproteobacteria bacterium]